MTKIIKNKKCAVWVPNLNMCSMNEAVCEYFLIIRIKRSSHTEIAQTSTIVGVCQAVDKLRGPISRHNNRIIVHLNRSPKQKEIMNKI
jgi:hypothetical protein